MFYYNFLLSIILLARKSKTAFKFTLERRYTGYANRPDEKGLFTLIVLCCLGNPEFFSFCFFLFCPITVNEAERLPLFSSLLGAGTMHEV